MVTRAQCVCAFACMRSGSGAGEVHKLKLQPRTRKRNRQPAGTRARGALSAAASKRDTVSYFCLRSSRSKAYW